MKSLLTLIAEYGHEQQMVGWVERYEEEMGMEGDEPCERDAHKDTVKQKRKAESALRRIYKLLGVKHG